MSPKAVKSRLKLVSQLHRLSIALGNAKKGNKPLKKELKLNENIKAKN